MSDDDLEQRIRTALRTDADNARVSPHAWTRVSSRLTDARPRSHRGRSIGLAVAGVAALATVGAILGPQLLRSNEPEPSGTPVIAAPSPKPTASANVLTAPGSVGHVRVGVEADVRLILSPSEDGAAVIQLAAYAITSHPMGRPPFAQVEVAKVAKPAEKIGVCQLRVQTGQAKTVTVSVAPDGKTCGKPVSYTIGDTQFTKTG